MATDWLTTTLKTAPTPAPGGSTATVKNDWLTSNTGNSGTSTYKPNQMASEIKTSTSVTPVAKKSSYFTTVMDTIKNIPGAMGSGLASVGSSLLDVAQMYAERYEKGKTPEPKKITGDLPKPITSLLTTEKVVKPLTPVKELTQKESKDKPTPLAPKSQIFAAISEPIKRWSKEVSPENPNFVEQLAQGAGSMGGYLLLSVATGFGATSLAVIESLSEAGSVYSRNRDKGMSVADASVKADQDLLANIVINYTTNKFGGLFDSGKKTLKKIIGTATAEGTQEAFQQLTSNITTNNPNPLEGVFESLGVGAVIGGGTKLVLPSGEVVQITGEQEKGDGVAIEDAKNIKDISPDQIIGGTVPEVQTNVEVTDETLKTLVKLDSAIANYKGDQGVTVLPSKEVTLSPALRELTDLSSKPEVIAKTQAQVATLPRDEDGKITLYRVGTLRPGDERLVSASVTREAAQAFAELQSVSKEARPLTAFKVNPEDIKVFIGGTEAEVLVQNPVKAEPTPSTEGVTLKSTEELIKHLGEGGFRSPEQIAKLKLDIEQNGIKYPINIIKQEDGSYIISDGNHRLQIAQDLGIKEVPVKEVTENPTPQEPESPTEPPKPAEIVQEKPTESPTLPKTEEPTPGVEPQKDVVAPERGGEGESGVAPNPVSTPGGVKKKSKAYTRVYDRIEEIYREDVDYTSLKITEEAEKAIDFVNTNPEDATRIAKGLQPAPEGYTETAISIAASERAFAAGELKLAAQLESARSLRQTRRGQEIVMEKGRVNQNGAHHYVAEVLKARLEGVVKRGSAIRKLAGETRTKAREAVDIIDSKAKVLKTRIDQSTLAKLQSAQELLNNLTCKI